VRALRPRDVCDLTGCVRCGSRWQLAQVCEIGLMTAAGASRAWAVCAGLQHEDDDDHDHHDDERGDCDGAGVHGNQRIPHRADASTDLVAERARALDGPGLAELRVAGAGCCAPEDACTFPRLVRV
jgi:hypothetical protein